MQFTVDFAPGDNLDIKEGPFMGHSGELLSIRGSKAILLLKSLKIKLTAEVPLNILSVTK